MKPLYYKRDGTPYTSKWATRRWAKDYENKKLREVKQETLKNGLYISTVWLGLDHSHGLGKPLIFETMVFEHKRGKGLSSLGKSLDQQRWSTVAEAFAGHYLMIKKWSSFRGLKPFRKHFANKGVK